MTIRPYRLCSVRSGRCLRRCGRGKTCTTNIIKHLVNEIYYRRLQHATPEQREDYEMDDEGIHWYALDEDVSFESFEYDNPKPEGVSKQAHPQLLFPFCIFAP